jgi:WD40 repeat protein
MSFIERIASSAADGRRLAARDGKSAMNDIAWCPDGTRRVTANYGSSAIVWDAATGARLFTLEGHSGPVLKAGFSPDGGRIVTASDDYTAGLWDARTGALLASLEGHGARLRAASFSPDGARILTASMDGRALVWDGETGALLASLDGHGAQLYAAAWSPDGARVVTAGQDGRAIIWDTHLETRAPGEIADLVRRRVPWRLEGGRLLRAAPTETGATP